MEQPPILGRPKWPGSQPEPRGEEAPAPAPHPTQTDGTPPAGPLAPPPPGGRPSTPSGQPAEQRSLRHLVLATAGVATVVLAVCNGLLLWLYQHAPLGVVVTLGTFIAAGALAWLRNRSRQLTVIVLYVQALVVVSAVIGIFVAVGVGVFTGIFAAGITLAGLVLLSLIGLIHSTGDRSRTATTVSAGTALAVVVSMIGAYALLTWDYRESTYVAPYEAPPERSVHFLVSQGQDYRSDGSHPAAAERAFDRYVCEGSRDEIAELFGGLVREGEQRLATPENVTVAGEGESSGAGTVTITATIHVIDDVDGTVLQGPDTWTFHLEKAPGDQYWRVCEIEHPA